jgi:hypothetical protein
MIKKVTPKKVISDNIKTKANKYESKSSLNGKMSFLKGNVKK